MKCNNHIKAKVKINGVLGIIETDNWYYSATRIDPEDYGYDLSWERL